MSRLHVSSAKIGFLAVASLMLAAGATLAHGGGGGHGGGGHGGGGHGGGHHGGFHYGGFHHGGMGNLYGNGFSRGLGYAPGYMYGRGYGLGYGLGYGYGLYGRGYGANLGFGNGLSNGYGFGYGSGYGGYGVTVPYGSGAGSYLYGTPTIRSYRSFYPPLQRSQQAQVTPKNNTARLQVIVPANAEIWFNGSKTKRTGTQREFVSPPLTQGKNYSYDIRARWTENGKPVEQTRSVRVQANGWQKIDFTQPQTPTAAAK